ncbi:hypothetical protein PDN47_25870 [Bacillus cereus]|nr:hypothetical protein [Bacillus cereus]
MNDQELPMKTGEIPGHYNNGPAYRLFSKGLHKPDYFSYGPYYEPANTGELTDICILCVAENIGGGSEPIATFDLVDHAAGGRNIANPITIHGRDLHGLSAFGIFLNHPVSINKSMQIENRIFVYGGSDLLFFNMHWYITST